MMDYSYANGKKVDQKAFDAMADAVKSIYYNKDNEIVMQKMDAAYDAVKQAADDAGYNNLQYFKYPSLSIRVTTQEITGYYNKLLDIANMGN
jgi:enolase